VYVELSQLQLRRNLGDTLGVEECDMAPLAVLMRLAKPLMEQRERRVHRRVRRGGHGGLFWRASLQAILVMAASQMCSASGLALHQL
jgi:hypothetical protein